MGVGAAHPERGDGGAPGAAGLRPAGRLGEELHRPGRPVDHGCRLVHVQGLGQHTVPHRLHHLDDATHPGGGHGVPDVGLQGAEQQWPLPALSIGRQQGARLDGVAEPGSGAVCFHRVHFGGVEPGIGQCLADHPFLGGAVRRGEAVARTVLVHRAAPDHGQHPMALGAGVREPLDHEQPDPLRPRGAVGGGRERLDPAVGSQPLLPREVDEATGGGGHGDASGQGERRLSAPQRPHRQMQGDQRGRARRVHGQRGALQPEGVGDTATGDTAELPGQQIALELLGSLEPEIALFDHTSEDTGP